METQRLRISKAWRIVLICGVVLVAGVSIPQLLAADDGDDGAKLGDLPKTIRQALRGVEVEEVEKEAEGGKTVYEVTIEVKEVEMELVLDGDGRLLGIEAEDDDEGSDDGDKDDDEDDDDGDEDDDRGENDD